MIFPLQKEKNWKLERTPLSDTNINHVKLINVYIDPSTGFRLCHHCNGTSQSSGGSKTSDKGGGSGHTDAEILILITFSLAKVWISLGENWSWSLLALKGIRGARSPIKFFWALWASFWSKKKGRARDPPPPLDPPLQSVTTYQPPFMTICGIN